MNRLACVSICFSLALLSCDLKASEASSQKAKIISAGKKALAGDSAGAIEDLQNATPLGIDHSLLVLSGRGIKPFYIVLTVFLRDGFPELARAGSDVLVKTKLPIEYALDLIGAYSISEYARVKTELKRAIDSLKPYINDNLKPYIDGVETLQQIYATDADAKETKGRLLDAHLEYITDFFAAEQARADWMTATTHPLSKIALKGHFMCKNLLSNFRYRLRQLRRR